MVHQDNKTIAGEGQRQVDVDVVEFPNQLPRLTRGVEGEVPGEDDGGMKLF